MEPLTFGERISLVRRRLGLTQQELAKRMGIAQTEIHRLETGLVKDPHMSRVVALANKLGVSTDWLLGRQDVVVEPPSPAAKRRRSRTAVQEELWPTEPEFVEVEPGSAVALVGG